MTGPRHDTARDTPGRGFVFEVIYYVSKTLNLTNSLTNQAGGGAVRPSEPQEKFHQASSLTGPTASDVSADERESSAVPGGRAIVCGLAARAPLHLVNVLPVRAESPSSQSESAKKVGVPERLGRYLKDLDIDPDL